MEAVKTENNSANFASFLNKMRQETASWPKWKRENAAYLFDEGSANPISTSQGKKEAEPKRREGGKEG